MVEDAGDGEGNGLITLETIAHISDITIRKLYDFATWHMANAAWLFKRHN